MVKPNPKNCGKRWKDRNWFAKPKKKTSARLKLQASALGTTRVLNASSSPIELSAIPCYTIKCMHTVYHTGQVAASKMIWAHTTRSLDAKCVNFWNKKTSPKLRMSSYFWQHIAQNIMRFNAWELHDLILARFLDAWSHMHTQRKPSGRSLCQCWL